MVSVCSIQAGDSVQRSVLDCLELDGCVGGVVGYVIAGRTRAKYKCRFLLRLRFLKRHSLFSMLWPITFLEVM